MADDPIELETKLQENAERMAEVRKQLDEQPSDMGENNQLQDKLVESVRKVHAGTQYLVSLRSISLMLASRMKAKAVRLRFS